MGPWELAVKDLDGGDPENVMAIAGRMPFISKTMKKMNQRRAWKESYLSGSHGRNLAWI
jgi:hypothetical protein